MTRCRYLNGDILYSDELKPDTSEGFNEAAVTGILTSDKGWKTTSSGNISFTIDAREIGVIWLQKNADPQGKCADYELIIDGESKGILKGVATSWGPHLEYKSEILGETAAPHTVTLRPAADNTGTDFEILGIGISK